MSFESIVFDAVAYYPLQELGGDAIDSIGNADLAPAGPVVYGVPGPSSWYPRGVGVGVVDSVFRQFLREGTTFLNGLVAYTVACWFRGSSAGVMIPVATATPDFLPSCGVFANLAYVVNDGVTTGLSTVPVTSDEWHYVSWRRDATGLIRRLGSDGVFESDTTQPNVFQPCIFRVGSFGDAHELAGVGVWGRELTDDEIGILQAGPIAPVDEPGPARRRRGSAGVRAAGRG